MSPQSTGTQSSSLCSAAPARYQDSANHMPISLFQFLQQQTQPFHPQTTSNSVSFNSPFGPVPTQQTNPQYTSFSVGVSFPSTDPGPPPLAMNPSSLLWTPNYPPSSRSWSASLQPKVADPRPAPNYLGPPALNFPSGPQPANLHAASLGVPHDTGLQPTNGDFSFSAPDFLSALHSVTRLPSVSVPPPPMAAAVNISSQYSHLSNQYDNLDAILKQIAENYNHAQPQPDSLSVTLTTWPQTLQQAAAPPPDMNPPPLLPPFIQNPAPYVPNIPNIPMLPSAPSAPYFSQFQSRPKEIGGSKMAPNAHPVSAPPKPRRRPSRPRQPKRHRGDQPFESTIVCGVLDPSVPVNASDSEVKASGDIEQYSDFFGFKVRTFMAVRDSTRQTLYQSSDLVRLLNLRHTYLAMHLKRKKTQCKGIWQAANVLFKRQSDKGIKSGSYFLSEEACREFKLHYENKKLSLDDDSNHSSTSE